MKTKKPTVGDFVEDDRISSEVPAPKDKSFSILNHFAGTIAFLVFFFAVEVIVRWIVFSCFNAHDILNLIVAVVLALADVLFILYAGYFIYRRTKRFIASRR